MMRLAVLACLLFAATAAASSPTVTVKTAVVTPRIVREEPPRSSPTHRRKGRLKVRAIARLRHIPRPLSPGEFGRTRTGS